MAGVLIAAGLLGSRLEAQGSPDSALYLKAQQMVSNGEAEAGRKIVDSLVSVAPPGSPQYAEGLYWRATLASSVQAAEKDYRRIIVDYPLSPRVPDALLRLGEVESARGDRQGALQHFQRLTIEHPESPLHAEASYWLARTYFETNDVQRGCVANTEATSLVAPANVELKNRIAFQQQRCRGVVLTQNGTAAPEAPAPVSAPVTTAPVATAAESAATETASPTAKSKAKSAARAGAKVIAQHAPTHTTARTATHMTTRAATRPASRQAAPPARGSFAVQVAAFKSRPQADELATKLRGRGYSAHVVGSAAPYRVRIGHYSTRAAAVVELARLKDKKISGFVTPE